MKRGQQQLALAHVRRLVEQDDRARADHRLEDVRALARVQHPNVVAVHDVGTFGTDVFIAMELVSGMTLSSWLRATPRTWRAIRDVFVAAGRGLAAAHSVLPISE